MTMATASKKVSSLDKPQETTLTSHLFGLKGRRKLTFEEFSAFIQGLQREVLKAEFLEYSRGMDAISDSDFAALLLRYTNLTDEVSLQGVYS